MKYLYIILFLFPVMLFAQRDFSAMQIEHSELAPGIHRLFIGNSVAAVAFAGEDGLMLIDAGYEQTTRQLRDTLASITGRPLRYLVNTHLHGDHTGGNVDLGKNVDIIAHHSVKTWLASDRRQGDRAPGPMPAHAIPNITFEGTLQMDFNGQTLEFYHLPGGHTAGDVIIFFPTSNVLVMGDLLFAGFFPFVDVSQGGHPLVFIEHLHWIMNKFQSEPAFIGGHGPVFNMTQLKAWVNALEQTMQVVAKAKNDGMSADDIKAAQLLAEWNDFGSFFITADRWIDTVYPFVGE